MKNEYLLGLDLGTSSLKAIIINTNGKFIARESQEYPLISPYSGWAEQDPQNWWLATQIATQQVVSRINGKILGIGFSGQMHGTILLSRNYQPLTPAIIWADNRSSHQVNQIQELIGEQRYAEITGTAPASGFMVSSLLWIKQNQPSLLDEVHKVLLPKDYLRFILTGNLASEPSDASSTGLFDIRHRDWAKEIISELGFPEHIFPKLIESAQICGLLLPSAAKALGLPPGIPVVAGCADQPAQAVGHGLFNPGKGSITLGSGGQIFIPILRPLPKPDPRLHIFCHAPPGRWYILGAMLTAGLSLRWLRDILGLSSDLNAYTKLSNLADTIPPGSDGLLFLPFLAGERSPLMDPSARGVFWGLTPKHSQAHLVRAVMEGVGFALRQILDTIDEGYKANTSFLASGNGLTNPIWRKITSNIIGRSLIHSNEIEAAGSGAALIAGIGIGHYKDYVELKNLHAKSSEITNPEMVISDIYEELYQHFLELYPTLKLKTTH